MTNKQETIPTLADTLRALAEMAKALEYEQSAIDSIADHAQEIASTLERVTAENAALRAERNRLRGVVDAAEALAKQAAHVCQGVTVKQKNIHSAAMEMVPLIVAFVKARAALTTPPKDAERP